jgi:lysophospholipase L1-like esterase
MRLGMGLILGIAAVAVAAACTVAPPPRPSAPAVSSVALLRIMPLGDSITYGLGSTDGAGYRADLARRLAAAGFRADFVGSQRSGPIGADDDNEGHGGWTIAQLTVGVDGWLGAYRPDVVLLHAGTNDVHRTNCANAAVRLGLLLDRIRRDAPATQVFVAEIVGSGSLGLQLRIARYNADVVRMVTARADPLLHLVDQGAVRAPYLHPNDAGYAAMADIWFTAVARSAVVTEGPGKPRPAAVPGRGSWITAPSRTDP